MPAGAGETNWAAVGYVLVATVLGSFAALWAQGAPVNRGMRSALYVTVGFVGSLFLLIGLIALLIPFTNPIGPILAGLAIVLPLWRRFRDAVARLIPIDPASPTHAVALGGLLLVLLLSAGAFLAAAGGGAAAPATSAVELVAQSFSLVVLSLFGVGLWLRRDWATALARLGLTRPRPAEIGLALLLAAGVLVLTILLRMFAPGPPADRLTEAIVAQIPNLAAAVAVALGAAVGLEMLFRGALQPRLGLPLTTLTFVAVHAIYPPTLPLLSLAALALGLGLLRRHATTSAAIIAHTAYGVGLAVWLTLAGG